MMLIDKQTRPDPTKIKSTDSTTKPSGAGGQVQLRPCKCGLQYPYSIVPAAGLLGGFLLDRWLIFFVHILGIDQR